MEECINNFIRNRFEDGMLLSAADLTNLQNYFDAKRRLSYYGLMGYGVVFGFTVEKSSDYITVGPGFAIDRQGREIYLPSADTLYLGSLLSDKPAVGEYFLCVKYAEEHCGEAFVISEKKLREIAHNRTREKYALTVKSSRDDGDICIARLAIEAQDGIVRIPSIRSPVDSFHFAPVWKELLPKQKHGSIHISHKEPLDESGIFRTKEIYHGLGCGKDVAIKLSVKTHDELRVCEIFGDSELFDLPVRVAAKLFPESGAFVIAVKPQAPMEAPICVRWHAYLAQGDDAHV